MALDDTDLDAIRDTFSEILDDRARIDSETHYTHHQFVAKRIEERRLSAERWESIRREAMKYIVLAGMAFVGFAIWHEITNRLAGG